jgi:glycosyltransferase involved in cell wall biosynthesis
MRQQQTNCVNHADPVSLGAAEPSAVASCVSDRAITTTTLRVFVLDLWCYIPYYDQYFCKSLQQVNIEPRLLAASYYLDPEYFNKHGLRNQPGFLDVVAKMRLRNQTARRFLMLVESCINMMALTAQFAMTKPDVLHIQWIPLVQKLPFDFWFMKFVRKCGIKIVYTVHNVLPHDTGDKFRRVYQRVYSEADALICHNKEAKSQLEREFSIPPGRIWTIPHGPLFHDVLVPRVADSRRRLDIPDDVCVVLMQGMLKRYKGVEFLLDTWPEVRTRCVSAQLIIAGSAEKNYEEELRAKILTLGIQDSVRLDFRYVSDEDLTDYYQASDIVVYPYKSITASGALMTGLSFAKAVIATDLAAFQEILTDGENSALVRFGDIPGLAKTLCRLIQEPSERVRLGIAAGRAAANRSWPVIAARTRGCYETVLTNTGELDGRRPERSA